MEPAKVAIPDPGVDGGGDDGLRQRLRGLVRKLRGSTLLRNSAWMLSGQGLGLVAQAGNFIVIARLLGSVEYGMIVGAAATVALLSQYGSLGSGLLFLRYVSPDHARFREYWGNCLLSSLICGTLLVCVVAGAAALFQRSLDLRVIVLLAIGDCICQQLTASASQIFQTFEKMRYTAALNLAMSCARLTVALTLLMTVHHVSVMTWAVASLTISALTTAAACAVVVRHFGLPVFRPRLFFARAWEGFIFSVSGSTTSVYNDVDKAMLAHFGMNAANGIYSMAYRVVEIGHMPIRSIHGAAFPRFFRLGAEKDGLAATEGFARRLLRKTLLLSAALAAGMFLAAPVIPVLVGKGFAPSVLALRWLCLIPLLRCFHLSAGDALVGAGKQTVRLSFQAVAAAINVGLNLYLIPHFGWRGAAWASLATDGLLGVMLWTVLGWLKRRAVVVPEAVPEVAQPVAFTLCG